MWPHQGTPLMLRITKPVGQVITAGFPTGPRNVMTVVFCISNYFMYKADYSSRPLFPNSRNHCFCSAKFHTPRSCPRSLPEELLQLFDIGHWGKGFCSSGSMRSCCWLHPRQAVQAVERFHVSSSFFLVYVSVARRIAPCVYRWQMCLYCFIGGTACGVNFARWLWNVKVDFHTLSSNKIPFKSCSNVQNTISTTKS